MWNEFGTRPRVNPTSGVSHKGFTEVIAPGLALTGSPDDSQMALVGDPAPVLVERRLPIVGQIFQFRRQNVTTRHESLVLVNSAILPRSLGLAELYRQRKACPPPDTQQPSAPTSLQTALSEASHR
jgi:hypothetical protein